MNKHTDCIGIGECTGIGESWHGPGNNFGEEKCCMSDGYCNQWAIPVNCRECSAKEKQCTTGDKLLIDENGNYVAPGTRAPAPSTAPLNRGQN